MNDLTKCKKITYRHYKGGMYIKLCEATHTETKEKLVIYTLLDSTEIYARPKKMFYEMITKDGYHGPRFKEV